MKIPWKLKSRLFRFLTFFPQGALYFAQRNFTRHAQVRLVEPHIGWIYHREVIKQTGARKIIEFGAGKNLAQNLYLVPYVDSQTVVDISPMLNLDMVNQAIRQLAEIGLLNDAHEISALDQLQSIYNIEYIAPFDMRNSNLPDNSFDLCISTNTLEHIPEKDIEDILAELHRLLKPAGSVSAMIDYSDHYAHSDEMIGRLNYLQFSSKEWEKYNHSNHYQNRLRHSHYGAMFRRFGFTINSEEAKNYESLSGLSLHDDLLTGDDSDFATTGFWHLRNM